MKIIYIFKRNDYAATLAAYLHLKKKMPEEKTKPKFEKMQLYFMGVDHNLAEIYLLKYPNKKHILMNILQGIGDIFKEEIKIIDLKDFDGYLAQLRYGTGEKNYRKALEEYINENYL
jgi:hypothetical protein